MKLLILLGAAVAAESCYKCKSTTRAILDEAPEKAYSIQSDKTKDSCFVPKETTAKRTCGKCFSIAYSLKHNTPNGTIYEYTMHRGCQEDYPSLRLDDSEPTYEDDKPNQPWKDVDLTYDNYGTLDTIKAKYMTHKADHNKARYDDDATEMQWNENYGLKCFFENELVEDGNSKKPNNNQKFACGSTEATSCYSLLANYDDDDKRYSYTKRGCSYATETISELQKESEGSVFFESIIPGTNINSTMELNYCTTDGCNDYVPTWKSSALSYSFSTLALVYTLF